MRDGQPAAQHRLQIDLASRLEEKPALMAAAQHSERARHRAEDSDAR
jgi:hypothetical protein